MKALHDRVWAQLAKYMTNEATDEEREYISTLLRENSAVAAWYRELCLYYESREVFEYKDPAPAFKKLDQRIKSVQVVEHDWLNF